MASARPPTDDPVASLSLPTDPPEEIMEANDTDTTSPATTETEEEISSPWIEVVRRSLRRRTPPPSKSALESPLPAALRHRPSTRQPRQPPIPTDDFKIGIRPRNGLQLSRADPISLTASIAREIGLPTLPAPFQLHVGAEQNVIVVSTPSPAVARALESLQKIVVFGNRHEISVYPITPYNSCRGVIHNIVQEHPEEYVKSLITAPGYEVLTARRLGDSKAFVITFRGKRVPYYVYVNQALLRCYHYRHTRKPPRDQRSTSCSVNTGTRHKEPRQEDSPKALNDTLEVARKKAGRHQLIVSGDFNAAHPLWGYAYANPRGNYLHTYIDDKAWVILNELNIPTRTGPSTCRDTTPDLSLSNKQSPYPDIFKNAFNSDRYRVTCTWNTTVDDARLARRSISRQYSQDADAVFTDAAAYPSYTAFALAVSPAQGGPTITATPSAR
ncbi:hypothetical protein HPB48_003986 [Haemaphysalis longicornis]|uniref:Endonuclease/exonuclease/phosphatase domain-containing protein n=1 Tax=Haemaphysalis longicornis TaxID=44386 RepID=A0A9J6G930_HAELO|nr:hypothetical protein HPB48_003986 [Haemaphysalis longicornis]